LKREIVEVKQVEKEAIDPLEKFKIKKKKYLESMQH
jgi:hypothetical protein